MEACKIMINDIKVKIIKDENTYYRVEDIYKIIWQAEIIFQKHVISFPYSSY